MVSMVCRLCLSEESLEMVFKEEGLQQCISDYLSIQVSSEDHLSKAVCTICRIRLIEFHQYRLRCHEVQDILQSMFRNEITGTDITSNQVTVNGLVAAVADSEPTPIQLQPVEELRKTDQQQFRCDVCNVTFNISRQLAVHRRIHDSLNNGNIVSKVDHEKKNTQKIKVGKIIHNDSSEKGVSLIGVNPDIVQLPVQMAANRRKITSEQECRKSISSLEEYDEPTDYEDEQHGMSDEHDYENSYDSDGLAMEEVTGPDQHWPCDACPKVCESKKQLVDHRWIHKPKNIECSVCKKRYIFPHQLRRHMERHRGADEENKYKCDICHTTYRFANSLTRHKNQMHGPKNFICPVCDTRFALRYYLMKHMKGHAENHESREDFFALEQTESPKGSTSVHEENDRDTESNSLTWFKCVKCPSSFKSRTDLLAHLRCKHAKNFNCSLCSLSFALSKQLNKHMQKIHNKEETSSTDPLICKECNKVFHVRRNLLRHMEIHGPLKHKCTVCGKLFKTSKAIARHIKIHSKSSAPNPEDHLGNGVQENITEELELVDAKEVASKGSNKKRSRSKLRQDVDTSNGYLQTSNKDSTPKKKKKLTTPVKGVANSDSNTSQSETVDVQGVEEEPVLVFEVEEIKLEPQ